MRLSQFGILIICAASSLLTCRTGFAAIYQSQTADGTIIFSDQPSKNSHRVTSLKKSPVFASSNMVNESTKKPEPKPGKASAASITIDILAPTSGSTVRKNMAQPVKVQIKMSASPPKNSVLNILVDNQIFAIVKQPKQILTYPLQGIARGEHTLQFVLEQSSNQQTLSRSQKITLYFHQTSILLGNTG